jgi:hypothetical protein
MALVTHAELKRVQTETTLPLRFRVILTLRFNNIRILAHRPILVKFLDVIGGSESDTQELSMLTQLGMDSVQTCVQSASTVLEIVGFLVNAGEMRRTLLGAWWYTLYYSMLHPYCYGTDKVLTTFSIQRRSGNLLRPPHQTHRCTQRPAAPVPAH